jgi:Mn-dependent DtxR family transcriptional regulator
MEIQKSGEDYLETILIIWQRKGYVRAVDVAAELNYSRPSVSKAMVILKERGYITVANDGQISLTESGNLRAAEVYERHLTLKTFFGKVLGCSEKTAEKDACLVEHVISAESYQQLKVLCNNLLDKYAADGI